MSVLGEESMNGDSRDFGKHCWRCADSKDCKVVVGVGLQYLCCVLSALPIVVIYQADRQDLRSHSAVRLQVRCRRQPTRMIGLHARHVPLSLTVISC